MRLKLINKGIITAYVSLVLLGLLWMFRSGALPPVEYLEITKGAADLSSFNFDTSIAFVNRGAAFYYGRLAPPESLIATEPDGYNFDDSFEYATTRILFAVPEGEYMVFGESQEYASRIYINGRVAGSFGIDDTGVTGYRVAPFKYPASPENGVIELVIQSASGIRGDASFYGYHIGEYQLASYYIFCKELQELTPIIIFAFCFSLYFYLFIFTPGERINLWFAMLSLTLGIFSAVTGDKLLAALLPRLGYRFIYAAANGALVSVGAFYVLFIREMYKKIIPMPFVISTCAVSGLLVVLLAVLPVKVSLKFLTAVMVLLVVVMAVSAFCIIRKLRVLRGEQIISFCAQLFFMLCGAADILRSRFDIRLLPFVTGNATTVGMLMFTFMQIAATLLHNRKIAMEKAALQRVNSLKTEFLINVSHELKTPLTVMSNYAQLTLRHEEQGHPDGYTKRNMKLIASEAERMAMMVGQLLEFARMERPEVKYTFAPVDLERTVNQTVEIYFPVLNKNRNALKLELPETLPRVTADEKRIVQVLVNLISNSLKFTRNGIITLGARVAEAGLVEVYVRDTGTGMPRNETDEAVSMGTGLGLHICREIVAAHGGELMTSSKPGEGTAVWFAIKIVDGDETNE